MVKKNTIKKVVSDIRNKQIDQINKANNTYYLVDSKSTQLSPDQKYRARQYNCAIVGDDITRMSPAIQAKTTKVLLHCIRDRKVRTFYFGALGPLERYCFAELTRLKEEFPDLHLVHFSSGRELVCNKKNIETVQKLFEEAGTKMPEMPVFDESVPCRLDPVLKFLDVPTERNRLMFKGVRVAIVYFNKNQKFYPDNKPVDMQRLTVGESRIDVSCYILRRLKQKIKVFNLAKQVITRPKQK